MSARVALVPRPRSSIISISFACEIRDGGWVSLSTIQGSPSSCEGLALLERRDLLVGGAGVGVDAGVAGVDDDRAADEVGLRAGLDVGAGRLGDHRRAEGGEEAAHDQFVDALLRALEGARVDRLGRVDRRVVGRLFFAAGRGQLAVEQARGGGELLDLDQRGDQLAQRQRGRVDRVVGARVGDEAVHVEVLGDPHRAGGGDAEAAGGVGAEGGRVVGGRRLARVLARRHRFDRARAGGAGERRVGLRLLPEFVDRVVGLEAAVGVLELGEQFPERFGDVGAALHLALDDQAQGRALDAADREEVGAEAAGGERDRAGQRRAPEQVDVLAGGAGVGERVGELVELAEGALDLLLGQRRVAGALDPQACRRRCPRASRAPGWRRASPPAPRARSARPRGRSRSRSPARRPPWRLS